MEGLNAFIDKLREIQYLHEPEYSILKRNEARIQAIMCEYAEQQAGRSAGR